MNLLERIKSWSTRREGGPQPDWEAVYREQLPRIYNYFRYRGCDDALAEDLAAETFEKAWRSRATFQGERGAAGAWLVGIARNTAASHFRAGRAALPLDAAEQVAETGPGPEEALAGRLEREDHHRRLARLLAALPAADRELIALKYGAGLTNRAIAAQTGLTETNVGTRIHRILRALREQIQPEAGQLPRPGWQEKPTHD